MPVPRLYRAIALLALFGCGGCDEGPVVEAVTPRPLALAQFYSYAGAAASDTGHATAMEMIVRKEIEESDFASLNAMADYFRTSQSRLPGGTWDLAAFHRTVQSALEPPVYASCALQGTDFTKAWADFDAQHPAPYIAEAGLLVSYGWCLRGGDVAGLTAPESLAAFRDYLSAAEELLSEHEEAAKRDPEYYALMQRIYMGQGRWGWPFESLLDEGASRFPYYYGIYFNAAQRALPQWGGSLDEVDAIARYAADRTREEDGEGAYVRVYWFIMELHPNLAEFPVDRARIALAMDDVMARHPSSWNASHFAWIACRLSDRELTAKQLLRGGGSVAWEDPDQQRWCRDFAS